MLLRRSHEVACRIFSRDGSSGKYSVTAELARAGSHLVSSVELSFENQPEVDHYVDFSHHGCLPLECPETKDH